MARLLLLFAITASLGAVDRCHGQTYRSAATTGYYDLYAQGVQAYFAGNSHRADTLLSEALAQNARDPRAYYFRGLARLRSGRRYEGEQDLRMGAAIEAGYRGRPLAMGHTLERVQGGDRLLLERIRREARQSYDVNQTANTQQRYQRTRDRSRQLTRTQFQLPLSALATAKSPQDLTDLAVAQAQSAGDPFADDPINRPPTPISVPDPARGALTLDQLGTAVGGIVSRLLPGAPQGAAGPGPGPGPGEAAGGMDAGPDAGDPFGDAPGADPFGDADPFGSGPDPFAAPPEQGPSEQAPANPPPAESTPAEQEPADADPFAMPPGQEDPFGGADPFGGDDPFAGDDPFGG